jgi:hypothetical protein
MVVKVSEQHFDPEGGGSIFLRNTDTSPTTWRHILEGSNLHGYRHENLNSQSSFALRQLGNELQGGGNLSSEWSQNVDGELAAIELIRCPHFMFHMKRSTSSVVTVQSSEECDVRTSLRKQSWVFSDRRNCNRWNGIPATI